jgi:hypothetical protein
LRAATDAALTGEHTTTMAEDAGIVAIPVKRGCLTFLPGSHRRAGHERIDITGLNLADLVREETRSYLFDYGQNCSGHRAPPFPCAPAMSPSITAVPRTRPARTAPPRTVCR